MKSPTLPAPAIATRISARRPVLRGDRGASSSARRRRRRSAGCRPPGRSRWACSTCAVPSRVMATSQNRPGSLSAASFLPAHAAGIGYVDQADLAAGVEPVVGLLLAGQQAAQHLVGGPRDDRDGRDAEPLVDHGPAGVVDPGDDALDPEVLPGDAGGEDVRVVAARHRGDGAGPVDARPRRGGRGRSRSPTICWPPKSSGRKRRNASAFLSITATVWPRRSRLSGELAAHPAAPDDDDVHGARLVPSRPSDAESRMPSPAGAAMACCGRRPRPVGHGRSSAPVVARARRKRGVAFVKRIFVGRPLATTEMEHQRIPKTIALAVFSSDAISSTAYATEEILFVIAVGALEPRARPRARSIPIGDRGRDPARRSSSRRTARRSSPTRAAAAATS